MSEKSAEAVTVVINGIAIGLVGQGKTTTSAAMVADLARRIGDGEFEVCNVKDIPEFEVAPVRQGRLSLLDLSASGESPFDHGKTTAFTATEADIARRYGGGEFVVFNVVYPGHLRRCVPLNRRDRIKAKRLRHGYANGK